ncbi:MAG: hybrid sensor histidine kinase/response regulator [Sneathiella sp.]|uniref:hybrid sensor histidine kinase/response regulator n=1 Tax=Sneathiella sp. TaxID=1964365 RepID=UPI000C65BB55|nr:PAS domain-containing sensor histidine kinase [Sneathiella sp.]MAL80714.1 hybrid sensor histidine kinase/response regulator [Sneathiella sp.]
MDQQIDRRRRNRKFFMGVDARQLAAAFFLVAVLIVISALLGRELGLVNIIILSAMVVAAMGLGLWYLIFHGLRQAASGNLDMMADLIASSPEGRLLTTKDGRFIYANDAYRELLDLSGLEEAITLGDYFADDEKARAQLERMLKAAVYDGTTGGRFDLETAKGRWLSILAHSLAALPDSIIWYVTETTGQHRLEEEERLAREKLSEYFNNAPVGFYSLDGEGRLLFANRMFADWLGYRQEELNAGALIFSDLVIKANEAQLDLMEIVTADGPLYEGELTLKRRDGTLLPVHVTQTIVRDEAGAVIGSRSVVRELLQEKEWRERVANAELHFRRFFEAAPIGILLLDAKGVVMEANPAFRALTGTVLNKAIGSHVTDLVDAADQKSLRQKLMEASASDLAAPAIEVKLLGATEERAASFYISAIAGEDPADERLLIHVVDTSIQRSLEVQFAQSQKMQAVGQLAGGIAHDFNNLLTAMIGFCDLLLLRHQVGDPSYSDINQIKQNANRAAGLVRQLLAFSRQQTLRPEVTDLTDVLAELSNLLRRLIGEAIQLKITHARDLWLVKVDRGQFEQVIINLAVNARDAMSGDGLLTFSTENLTISPGQKDYNDLIPPGDYILVRVSDTGTGIPEKVLVKIFEPFFTTKKVGEGTGLGLSTVYGIIKQTGGFIFAENNEDIGTTFSIFLPRYTEEARAGDTTDAPQKAAHRDLTGKGTILLVEDEDPVRLFAARALENVGYTVLQADCGEAALEVSRAHDGAIDLLISDVVMPVMDGPALVKEILKETPDLKVIFISGYAEDAFRKDLDFDVSKIDFLPKPFSLKEVASKVKEVLMRE